MPFAKITKTILLLCVISFVILSLVSLIFELTDYNVYRVLDISFQDTLLIILFFAVQYFLLKQVPSNLPVAWHTVKKNKSSIFIFGFIALLGCGAFSLLSSGLSAGIFFYNPFSLKCIFIFDKKEVQ